MRKTILQCAVLLALLAVSVWLWRYKAAATYSNRGLELVSQGELQEAKGNFESALALKPDAAQPWAGLGRVYRGQGDLSQAAHAYSQALRFDPAYAPAYVGLGEVYRSQGEYPRAMEVIAGGMKACPQDEALEESSRILAEEYSAVLLDKAGDAMMGKDVAQGLAALDKAIQVNPGFINSYYLRASYYISTGQFSDAQRDLDAARGVDPRFWLGYKLQGDVFRLKGDFPEALFQYRQALEAKPGSAELYHEVALLLMRMERYPEALEYARLAVGKDPQNPQMRYSLASIYRDNGMDKAEEVYQEVIAMQRDYPGVYNDLGEIYSRKGDTARSQAAFQQEASNSLARLSIGATPDAYSDLGAAYMGLQQYPQALESAEQARSLDPAHPQANLLRARVLERMARYEESLAAYGQAAPLWGNPEFISREMREVKEKAWKK